MERTEATSNQIPTDQLVFPARYLWGAPFVMATYMYFGVNPDFIIIDGKNASTQIINCVAHAFMRTVIATYIACMVRMLMESCQKQFKFSSEWIPYIHVLDVFFYVVHGLVPSGKLVWLFYGKNNTPVKEPTAMIFITGALLLVLLVVRLILCLIRNPTLLQKIYENVTGVTKLSQTSNTNVPQSSRRNDGM